MNILFVRHLKYNWKLYKFNKFISNNYFNNYEKHSELDFMQNLCNKFDGTDVVNNVNNMLNANQIIYGNLKKQYWSFFDFIDNKEYTVFNIIMLSPHVFIFFFNINNPCFLIQNYCYMDFFYFGRVKNKNLIQIANSSSGNELDLPIIENNLNFIYSVGVSNKIVTFSKKMFFFGMLSNVGHHLWNEISGLVHFINNKKNIDLIDGIIIGPYDFFNTEKYLNDICNIKTVKLNANKYPICLTIYPVLINSIILDNTCKKYVKEILNYTPENITSLHAKKKQFVFDIRTFSRVLLNITETYIFIIDQIYKLIGDKYIINIVFTGRFLTDLNDINILIDTDIISQNKIVNEIISNFNNTNIIFDNLIGKKIDKIINHIGNCDFMIMMFGTSAPNIINWICDNTKGVGFVQPTNYSLYKQVCYTLDNQSVINVPYECFDTLTNNDIIVKYDIFYKFLYNVFFKCL